VQEALAHLDPLWDELFPAEQARIVRVLVERVDVSPGVADIRLRMEGLTNLVRGLGAGSRRAAGLPLPPLSEQWLVGWNLQCSALDFRCNPAGLAPPLLHGRDSSQVGGTPVV
jgi:hypothetical protein